MNTDAVKTAKTALFDTLAGSHIFSERTAFDIAASIDRLIEARLRALMDDERYGN